MTLLKRRQFRGYDISAVKRGRNLAFIHEPNIEDHDEYMDTREGKKMHIQSA